MLVAGVALSEAVALPEPATVTVDVMPDTPVAAIDAPELEMDEPAGVDDGTGLVLTLPPLHAATPNAIKATSAARRFLSTANLRVAK
jgi:hypothetical protein